MFSYIRWVSAVSFLLVMLAVFFFGRELREVASQDLTAVANNSNASLAQGFINTTWKNYRTQMHAGMEWYNKFRASGVPYDQWKNYHGYSEMMNDFSVLDAFSRDVFKYFEDTPIVEATIYSAGGIRILSVNQSSALSPQNTEGMFSTSPPQAERKDGAFDKAIAGTMSGGVVENQAFVRPDGVAIRGTLVKALVPILENKDSQFSPAVVVNCKSPDKTGPGCGSAPSVEAVLEIRYDVTAQWSRLDMLQHIGMFAVMGLFSVIILLLLFTSGRAESIIAKQHEANVELAAQAANAQAENRDKSQFLANISHELRTPLNAIIGFSEFIKSERSGKIGNEKYAEYIRDIHNSGVHLLSLINDILDYSKAEADKLELEISEVDATKAVKNSMRLVSPRAESAQVQILEEIPREHFIIHTDPKKLKQVMLNLLSNAVKFTPSGGSVTVTMWQNVVDGGLSIEVKDTGIGIAPKDISRAMAPFGQVDNTLSRKYEGTGLGLPLTRKFVEIMGGIFAIASEVGKGTTITVSLPKESKGRIAKNIDAETQVVKPVPTPTNTNAASINMVEKTVPEKTVIEQAAALASSTGNA